MKQCPVCQRTYDDATQMFCLNDGSLLSALPEPAQVVPVETSAAQAETTALFLPPLPAAPKAPAPSLPSLPAMPTAPVSPSLPPLPPASNAAPSFAPQYAPPAPTPSNKTTPLYAGGAILVVLLLIGVNRLMIAKPANPTQTPIKAWFGRFTGRGVFGGLIAARLVLPDVLVGLSLLLLFVQMEEWVGWPAGRGALTITLAHVSVSLAYVAVLIEARLADAGTELEQAAMDLGASPSQAFWLVTLPLLAPAIVSGWLLAFTLSLDDLVVASFVSGPGASTLPMVVFSALRLGVTPELNALATVILVVVSVALGGAWALQRRRG